MLELSFSSMDSAILASLGMALLALAAELSGRELIRRCIKRDDAAWTLFVERYSRRIYWTIHRTLEKHNVTDRSQERVEELFQDVFVHLIADDFRRLRSFEGRNGCSVGVWLQAVSRNMIVDDLRRGRIRTVPLVENPEEDQDRQIITRPVDPNAGPEQEMEGRETLVALCEFIDELSPKDRLIFKLAILDGLPHEEVGRIVELSAGAVSVRIHRIRRRLRKKMKEAGLA